MKRDVYSRHLKLHGEEHVETLIAAGNYTSAVLHLKRFDEAKGLTRKVIPVTRRVLGESNEVMLKMKKIHALALVMDDSATLDDFREAVTTLEDTAPTARRVLGGAHPTTQGIEAALRDAQAALRARETPSTR